MHEHATSSDTPDRRLRPPFHSPRMTGTRALPIFLGTVALLLASFLLQLQLTSQPGIISSSTFAWLIGLGAVTGLLLSSSRLQPLSAWIVSPLEAPQQSPRSAYLLGGVALFCALVGAWLVHSGGAALGALIAWLVGLMLLASAAWRADALQWPSALAVRQRVLPQTVAGAAPAIIVVAIVIGAAALRLIAIDTIPGYIHNDEASNGLMARSVADGQISSLFSYGWASLPMLGYCWDGLFFKLFGDNLASLRDSSAILGIAAIVVVFLLGKELFSVRAGLLAAVLLALFHVEIHFSRVGHHYIQALFAVTLTLYLLVLYLRYGSRLAAAAGGVLLSVDIQVYYAARVAYVIVPLVVAYLLLVSDRAAIRARLPGLGWFVLGWLVGVLPIGAYILGDWSDFTGRTREVLVLGGTLDTQNHVFGGYGTHDAWTILRTQAWRVIQTFNFQGDTSLQYGIEHPMLDPVSAALLPAAVFYALFRADRAGYAICLIGFFSAIIVGGVATIDPPFWPRLIVVVPFLALLIAALLDELWLLLEGITLLRWLAWPAVLLLLAAIGYGNYRWYFSEYAPAVHHNFIAAPMDIGLYLRPITDNPSVYGITDGSIDVTHQAVQLLAPQIQACNIWSGVDVRQCSFPPQHDRIIFVAPARASLLPLLRQTYPGGTLQVLRAYDLGQTIYVYRVQHS